MHCSNFFGHIYVEKTSKQCSFNHHYSQRAKEDTWWDIYLSGGLDDEQVYDQNSLKKKLYNVKDLLEGGGSGDIEKWKKKRITVTLKIVLAL